MEFVESILEDVKWLLGDEGEGSEVATATEDGPWSGPVRYSSDYFDLFYDAAVHLIKKGKAYVDSLSAEEMREYRGTLTEPGRDSPDRSRSIEENLQLFRLETKLDWFSHLAH